MWIFFGKRGIPRCSCLGPVRHVRGLGRARHGAVLETRSHPLPQPGPVGPSLTLHSSVAAAQTYDF